MTNSEHLRAAVNVLRRDGWCRGAFTNTRGEHCMVGALYAVCGIVPIPLEISDVCGGSVIGFNERHCKTKNDAIAALAIAADLAE